MTVFKIIYSKLKTTEPGYIFRPPFVSQKKVMSDTNETQKSLGELDWVPMTRLVFKFYNEDFNKDDGMIKL